MLVIKAYVNRDQIDEIHIHNLGAIGPSDFWTPAGLYTYRIEKPTGYEKDLIAHRRSEGWQILAEKALKVLTESRGE